jgi:hypothetical protein
VIQIEGRLAFASFHKNEGPGFQLSETETFSLKRINNGKKESTMPDRERSPYAGLGELNSDAESVDHPTIDQIAAAFGGPTREGHDMRSSDARIRPACATLNRNLWAILDKFEIMEPARMAIMTEIISFETSVGIKDRQSGG